MLQTNQIPEGLGGGIADLARRHAAGLAGAADSYKGLARARRSILEGNWGAQVARQLERTHYDPHIKGRLGRHVTQVFNVSADVTATLACVYKSGARRSSGLASADKALARLNELTHFGTLGPRLNRLGWFVGPTLEVPAVRGKRVVREILPNDQYDLLLDPDDPLGPPIAAAWTWPINGQPMIVVLDRTHYHYFEPNRLDKPAHSVRHGMTDGEGDPVFPGTIWRFDIPTDPHDYFCKYRHARAVAATIEIGGIASIMSMVRKSQNRKIVGLFGNLEKLASYTKLDPEMPLTMQIESDDPLPIFKVEDFNTPISHFRDHIMLLTRTMIEAYGIPQSAVTYDVASDQGTLGGLELQHEKLSQFRNEQIPFAREAELSSQYKLAETVRLAGHSAAKGLPTKKRMLDLSIEFAELNRIEDPSNLALLSNWELQRGQTTDAKLYQRRHPHLTIEEARAEVHANVEEQGNLNEKKAKRMNDPAQPVEDANQITGRIGGQAPNPNAEKEE